MTFPKRIDNSSHKSMGQRINATAYSTLAQ
jgi:hypothetical protein